MRSGLLGRLGEDVAMETEQPVGDSNLQEFMQPSSSTLNSQPANALGKVLTDKLQCNVSFFALLLQWTQPYTGFSIRFFKVGGKCFGEGVEGKILWQRCNLRVPKAQVWKNFEIWAS